MTKEVTKVVERELAAIKQELKDLKEIVLDIQTQTRKTNGSVADCKTRITVLEEKEGFTKENRDWTGKKVTIVIAGMGIFFTIVNIILRVYGI